MEQNTRPLGDIDKSIQYDIKNIQWIQYGLNVLTLKIFCCQLNIAPFVWNVGRRILKSVTSDR